MLATIVDWRALADVVVLSLAATLLITVLFTTGVLAFAGPDGTSPSRRALGLLGFALSGALVVLGLFVMFTTK